jgi:hypothetical protein
MLLPSLSREDAKTVLARAARSLVPSGSLIVSCFDRRDPGYERDRRESCCEEVDAASFWCQRRGVHRSYYVRKDLTTWLVGLNTVIRTARIVDRSHGPSHAHVILTAVGVRPSSTP